MKARAHFSFCLSASIVLLIVSGRSIGSESATTSEPTLQAVQLGGEIERGPHHRVLATVSLVLDANGKAAFETNCIVELATGLHRRDPTTGEYVAAKAEFEAVPDGYVVARQTAHQAILSPNLRTEGAVDLLTPDGVRLRATPVALAYLDAASGQRVLLAEVKDCAAKLVSPTEVLYADAFAGLLADVRFRLSLDGFEQDIVLREQPPGPKVFGLDPATTWLQVLTEFFEAPEPVKQVRVLKAESDPARRAQMAWPDLVDEQLGFGEMAMGPGQAFAVGEEAGAERVPVGKSWETVEGGRRLLAESVEYGAVERLLESLSATAQASTQSREDGSAEARGFGLPISPGGSADYADARRFEFAIPQSCPAPVASTDAPHFVGRRLLCPDPPVALAQSGGREQDWSIQGGKAVVLDWQLLNSSGSVTLAGDTTYYVSGTVNVSNLSIEGGTVVKFTNDLSARISVASSLVCRTAPYRPAVFTSKDDDSVGEVIPGSSGNPTMNYYGNPALQIMTSGQRLEHVRVAHAWTGVLFHDYSAGTQNTVAHAQMVRCSTTFGVRGYGYTVQYFALRNALIHNTGTAFSGYNFQGTIEHLTLNGCAVQLGYSSSGASSLVLTNSLLVSVSSPGNVSVTKSYCAEPTGGGVFQTVGKGAHYLPAGSPYRNVGTPDINPFLATELRRLTTYAPLERTVDFTTDTVLVRRAWRDTDVPDLGYHYYPLDWVWSGRNLSGATLRLIGGVAVGIYGASGTILGNGAKFISEGSPSPMNRLVRYTTVQEQPLIWGSGGYGTRSLLKITSSPSGSPEVQLRFTDVSLMADTCGNRRLFDNASTWTINTLALKDCTVYGGTLSMSMYPLQGDTRMMTVALTNNLLHRVDFSLDQDSDYPRLLVMLRNNLFRGGRLKVADYNGTGTWSARDNLFDQTNLAYSQAVPNSNNGYTASSPLPGSSGGDILNLVPDYVTGPLGDYYYPATGANLAQLLDAGSRPGDAAGLYHYTTLTNQIREVNSQVDIGFHYVAVGQRTAWELSKAGMTASASSQYYTWVPANAINSSLGDPGWHNNVQYENPAYLRLDLGSAQTLYRVEYCPRVAAGNGSFLNYKIYVTDSAGGDPAGWGAEVVKGTWSWGGAQVTKALEFTPKAGRYVIFRAVSGINGWASANEVWVYATSGGVAGDSPMNSDGDFLPDYYEDQDGNGLAAGDALAFDDLDTDNNGLRDGQVTVTNIRFNYDTGSFLNDALNIRQDYLNPYDLSEGEWVKGGQNVPACYRANQSVMIQAKLQIEPPSLLLADVSAVSSETTGGSLGNVFEALVTFNNGVSDYVTFLLAGTTPSCIKKTTGDKWQWMAQNVGGSGSSPKNMNESGPHTIYTILDAPVPPWNNTWDNSANAWVSALDFVIASGSCNCNGVTQPSEALVRITQYLHSTGFGMTYDTTNGAPYYGMVWGTSGDFNLTDYMCGHGVVNCYDQAAGLTVCARLLGIGVDYLFMQPFGYILATDLVGIGPCNNPLFNDPRCEDRQPLLDPPEGVTDEVYPNRMPFGNHAFVRYVASILDATGGPHTGTESLLGYAGASIDISTMAERWHDSFGTLSPDADLDGAFTQGEVDDALSPQTNVTGVY